MLFNYSIFYYYLLKLPIVKKWLQKRLTEWGSIHENLLHCKHWSHTFRLKKSIQFLVIGWFQNRYGDTYFYFNFFFVIFFFWPSSEIHICGYWNQTKFPIHKVWWLRQALLIGQTSIPPTCTCTCMWTSRLKTQHSRIPIDPATLAAIGQRFIAKIKK